MCQPATLTRLLQPAPCCFPTTCCSLTALHRLAVESHSPACKTPALRSLACLPRIRRLAVGQAHQLQSFVGLTNLGSLKGESSRDTQGWYGCSSFVGLTNRRTLRVRSKSWQGR